MSGARDAFPLPEDLRVFLTVIRKKSFAAAAEELGLSPAYVSKRIQILEATLSTRLLHRTTRRVALTEDGERTQRWALRILADVDELFDELSVARQTPRGLLRISSSLGFGRSHLAPALAQMVELYPELNVRLELFDRVVDIVAEGIDLEILVGDDLPGQCIGRRLADNNRVLCASPTYLQRHGCPQELEDLQSHDCLVIKERDYPFGIWHLERQGQGHSVRVDGPLSSNSGEVVLAWALAGRGIMLRSQWEVQPLLASGALVHVLPEYRQSANVWAVYPTRLAHSARLRACVEFLEQYLAALPVFGHDS